MTRHTASQASTVVSRRRPTPVRSLGEPFSFHGRSVVAVHSGFYRNGQHRLVIVDERSGALVATPTFPVDSNAPLRYLDTVLVSDSGPCRGIVAALEKSGVISDTGVMVDDRHGRLHVCELLEQVSR